MSCRRFVFTVLLAATAIPTGASAQEFSNRDPFRGDCLSREEFADRDVPLANLSLDTSVVADKIPIDCSTSLYAEGLETSFLPRRAEELEFHWAASELYHQPLYFDDTLLERYGQSRHPLVQPALSGAFTGG